MGGFPIDLVCFLLVILQNIEEKFKFWNIMGEKLTR